MSESAHSLEAGSNFIAHKKSRITKSDAAFFGQRNGSRLRGNVSPPTHAPGVHCALGALF
ncbi:MAG: hypothetical protein FWF77_07880 [Defluviitaleaceae bacterium]|nr:hypothetical protein [Defluviitaleaceae bacterium]